MYSDDRIVNFTLLYLRKEHSIVQELIRQFGVSAFTYSKERLPKAELAVIQRKQLELVEEEKALVKKIGQKKAIVERLEIAEEVLLARKNRWLVQNRFVKDDKLFLVTEQSLLQNCHKNCPLHSPHKLSF